MLLSELAPRIPHPFLQVAGFLRTTSRPRGAQPDGNPGGIPTCWRRHTGSSAMPRHTAPRKPSVCTCAHGLWPLLPHNRINAPESTLRPAPCFAWHRGSPANRGVTRGEARVHGGSACFLPVWSPWSREGSVGGGHTYSEPASTLGPRT